MKTILWCSVLLATAFYICVPVMDPDLWWHITSGRWILAHAQIPQVDHWNRFWISKPWLAYSWLIEVIFALTDRYFSSSGLLVLSLTLTLLIGLSIFLVLSLIAHDWFFGALLGVVTTTSLFNHFTLRPQSFVWIYLVLVIFIAERISRKGPTLGTYSALFVVMMLWANTHITTALGLGTVLLWLFDRNRWHLSIEATSIGFFGTLCTPYAGREWLTFLSKTSHPFSHSTIAEFQPATIMQYSTAFTVFLLFMGAVFYQLRPKSLELSKLLLAGGFLVGGLAVVKFLPFANICLATLIALWWSREEGTRRVLTETPGLIGAIEQMRKGFNRLPREGLSFVCICLAILNVAKLWMAPVDTSIVPEKAVDFILSRDLPKPLMNGFGEGGYLMYRLSNADGTLKYPVSIDGRTNTIPSVVWERYSASLLGRNSWQSYIDLIEPKTVLWKTESALTSILLATGKWERVFRMGSETQGFSVLVRKDSV